MKKVLVCFSNKKQEGVVMLRKILLMGLFFIPFLSYGNFLSVCERTPQVRDAIMEKIAHLDSSIECGDDDFIALALSEIAYLDLEEQSAATSLKAGDFSGLSSLWHLDLRENQITSLPEGIFSGLSSLVNLNLSANQITSLPEGVFSGLSSLKTLNLSYNKISLLEGVFSSLSSLEILGLSYNQITSLPEGIFSGLSSLEILYLNDNQIASLSESAFSDIPSLKKLYLEDNQITSLPGGELSSLPIFSGLSLLEVLTMNNNPLNKRTKYRLLQLRDSNSDRIVEF